MPLYMGKSEAIPSMVKEDLKQHNVPSFREKVMKVCC